MNNIVIVNANTNVAKHAGKLQVDSVAVALVCLETVS